MRLRLFTYGLHFVKKNYLLFVPHFRNEVGVTREKGYENFAVLLYVKSTLRFFVILISLSFI